MNDEAPTPVEDREPDVDAHVEEATAEPQQPRPARPRAVGATRLPDNSDVAQWTTQQGAMARAAGLVFVFPDWHDRAGEEVIAPPPVVERFLSVCHRTGLDPLARQVYCIGRVSKGDPSGVEWSIQTGIDGFRVVAERTGQYRGRAPFQWLTKDRKWVDVFIPGADYDGPHPLAARATVYREGWPHPTVAVAEWGAYAQTKSRGGLTAMWEKQGPGQLAKCAEALALRTTFPQDLSGVYTDDEQAGPQAAIEQSRRDEAAADAIDWQDVVDGCESEAEVQTVQARMVAEAAPPTAHAAALARLAHIRSSAVAEPEGVVSTGAATADAEPDDASWKGAPCPACGGAHDPSVHDIVEPEPITAAALVRPAFNPAAMMKGSRP